MTSDSGNDNFSNDLSEIANVVGKLPANVLESLKKLPAEFINRLSHLSPEAVDQLTRLPIDMLAGLTGMPGEMLEWLGRVSARSDSGLSPEVLAQFIKGASTSSQPLRTLKAIPKEMLSVIATIPVEVFDSLMELPHH